MQETGLALVREAACREFLQRVRAIETEAHDGFPGQRLLETMHEFVDHHRALLPDADFGPPRAYSRMHPLSEAVDTPYGLYLNVTRPGKQAEPHCHGLWSVSVALSGRELNRFWRVVDQTSSTQARVEETHSITLAPGTGLVMTPDDVHSTLTLEGGEARMLHLFARPFDQFPRVAFYHPAWGTRRLLPQGSGRTLRGG